VLEAMLPFQTKFFANASSIYKIGRLSRSAIDTAREQIASLVQCDPREVIFTSGGSEANNMAIKGMASARPFSTIISNTTEHPSVTKPIAALEKSGWPLITLLVDSNGKPDFSQLHDLEAHNLGFSVLMHANNETGIINDVARFAFEIGKHGGWLHVDAVQTVGKIPVNFHGIGAQSMSISAHKINGPKGVGSLILDSSLDIDPLIRGGSQEKGLRAGTENVAGIVGFGRAAEIALNELDVRASFCQKLRDKIEMAFSSESHICIHARQTDRLPNTLQFSLKGYDGEMIVMLMDKMGFAVSSGSACSNLESGSRPVLAAMGVEYELARSAVRISLGQGNTESEIDQFIKTIKQLVH